MANDSSTQALRTALVLVFLGENRVEQKIWRYLREILLLEAEKAEKPN
ncbi:MAG: hypothetical protein IJK56_05010 [Firmicutes bacterium]|nr:hypothetical protein [Bacillota bacterium]